ncbi:SAM-dependent methyltransferase [bacterium (Candidatus Blackallbacteria) CG17_big_fil_post_rev_8_21_14_2_50_48_46]|uniref:SAM-dependent methyltransferase n=1 Tax=bacterium (Candidatus Blackallbacteria) CG17_big_fil_post_rev_8_21_14_2_50_48_46 TaxID=2014261 RepID=A0A2M7G745_9BACT|nr:MAG: SAM-dependent methyltransferase [bacterium (Candidatus Blackallbacteria) CG18_big_fil_WC_8_21_14_2_50_49_26]PIW17879.1 MAG: SAM-dependent methyltransferase [bacterium (Candidatus Blackallbacteria) CG17_big_fil_post_rev_8_21_14_2_50_48_46]PIW48555.1 MAG: SAM-dependent methyltransferase [bacterium (Candidatus Blackallbacteria) CG13_big_fil_rev_8_21_14_2_50_49_14]
MILPDLRQRSQAQELLDAPELPQAELWRNLEELEIINRWLGGHRVTLQGLQRLIRDRQKTWKIVDIGCGGGDTLKAIAHWGQARGIKLQLTGVDLKPECLAFAQKACQGLEIKWICSDYRAIDSAYDIVLTSLFCHHLETAQLRQFLRWSQQSARHGLLINDLHRHPLAWGGIRLLTQLFSRSYLVKHDAPLSVWRGFERRELETLLAETGWKADLEWCWAFRYRVLGYV